MKVIYFVLLFWGFVFSLHGQGDIILKNPSFENIPRAGTVTGPAPKGWYDCGSKGESAPDIQPGFFGVSTPASDGQSYLGLVIRDNDTWEAIGQELENAFVKDSAYLLQIDLTRSTNYLSPSRMEAFDSVSYIKPAVLRIWGGNGQCDRQELLGVSDIITHTDWQSYSFLLHPKESYSYLVLEAYYQTPVLLTYNGNILVDNCSTIRFTPKEEIASLDLSVKPADVRAAKELAAIKEQFDSFKNLHQISRANLADKIFTLVNPIYELEVDYLNFPLSSVYFLESLQQHTESSIKFQNYWKEYSISQFDHTSRLLLTNGFDKQFMHDFNSLVNIIKRKESGKKLPKKLRKLDPDLLMESIRGQLNKNNLDDTIQTITNDNFDLLTKQLFNVIS